MWHGVAIFTHDGVETSEFVQRVHIDKFGDFNQHGPGSISFYTHAKSVTSR